MTEYATVKEPLSVLTTEEKYQSLIYFYNQERIILLIPETITKDLEITIFITKGLKIIAKMGFHNG